MISFSCTHCGIRIETDDSLAGRSGACPGCSRILQIPLPRQAAAPCPSPFAGGAGPQRRRLKWKRWAFPAVFLLLLFFLLHPWPQFGWAAFRGKPEGYESFAERFPDSPRAEQAMERAHALREEPVWNYALESGHIDSYRKYINEYPEGAHLDEAREAIRAIADRQWEKHIAASRREDQIRNFLIEYPETSKGPAADARLQELYDDPEWLREAGGPDHFRSFVARFPEHPARKEIEDLLVRSEMDKISAADHGRMPAIEPARTGGKDALVEWTNDTPHSLNILYHGLDWGEVSLKPGESRSVVLPPGAYKVAADVRSPDVIDYYGDTRFAAGSYSISIYIKDDER